MMSNVGRRGLHQNPGCPGFHHCKACRHNKARRGLLDETGNPDTEQVNLIKAANRMIGR